MAGPASLAGLYRLSATTATARMREPWLIKSANCSFHCKLFGNTDPLLSACPVALLRVYFIGRFVQQNGPSHCRWSRFLAWEWSSRICTAFNRSMTCMRGIVLPVIFCAPASPDHWVGAFKLFHVRGWSCVNTARGRETGLLKSTYCSVLCKIYGNIVLLIITCPVALLHVHSVQCFTTTDGRLRTRRPWFPAWEWSQRIGTDFAMFPTFLRVIVFYISPVPLSCPTSRFWFLNSSMLPRITLAQHYRSRCSVYFDTK